MIIKRFTSICRVHEMRHLDLPFKYIHFFSNRNFCHEYVFIFSFLNKSMVLTLNWHHDSMFAIY